MRNHLQGSSVALDWQLSESTDCVLIALVPPGSNRWLPQGVCSGNVCECRCCTYPKCTPSPPTAMSVLLLLSSLNTYYAPDNVLRHWGHRAFALQELTASPGRQGVRMEEIGWHDWYEQTQADKTGNILFLPHRRKTLRFIEH